MTPPSLQESVVPRPRVAAVLRELIDENPVVCVYATAGAGKTTAVLQALDDSPNSIAWLSVDETDAAPGRLLTYLQAALAQAGHATSEAMSALRAGVPHPEVAGILADTIASLPVTVVLDNAERIASSPEALELVSRLGRYLGGRARLVVVSRQELDFRSMPSAMIVGLDERDLAFTAAEAESALARLGRSDVDIPAVVHATGGWVAGVLFEAWRSRDHSTGLNGEADPLHGYLAVHILDQLCPEQRDFLIRTSVLDEVTGPAAAALGVSSAARHLHTLRSAHIPAMWVPGNEDALRCHPRFREYLLTLLARRDASEVTEIYRRHAIMLGVAHRYEEATEELLKADLLPEALAQAEKAVESVVDRGDFAIVRSWLSRFGPLPTERNEALAGAELMMALATEDYGGGLAVADRLREHGLRDALARSSSKYASAMAWCYFHAGRINEIRAVLDVARPGLEIDAMRYCMTLLADGADGPDITGDCVPLSGGPLDALIMRTHYYRGRLALMLDEPASRWAAIAARSWQLGARLAMGQLEQAATLYEEALDAGTVGVWSEALFSVQLFRAQGRHADAWRALLNGRERIRASGSSLLEAFSYLIQAELELLLNQDPGAAQAVLGRLRTHPVGGSYGFIVEQAETWLGLSYLMQADAAQAARHLEHAVRSMRTTERVLMLPAAAVYLAEASWRLGDENAADRAMNVALDAADRQGSRQSLLQAIELFPSTLSRRLDAESSCESDWHRLGRALIARDVELDHHVGASIEIADFGEIEVRVDGRLVRPQIKKSAELLVFLAHQPDRSATRDQLLDALFEGRRTESSSSYLRQAVRWLREVLPGEDGVEGVGRKIRINSDLRLMSESEHFKRVVAEASSLRGTARYRVLLGALDIAARGPFAAGVKSRWAEERRRDLDAVLVDVRCSVAELAFADGDHHAAAAHLGLVLRLDPYRESMWRLAMRLADANGDADGVLAAYRSCELALQDLGTGPDTATAKLFRGLRR
ncbi:BTAD domain-containing putative transcriptional regulator [Pseudonocardia benzenivorans]|uniref:BTAD domain-containing putative transcriptional regulator n=1 Tax=Pseudonocardia benzenivorans TaxID=228005 RepID=A0ABW3VDB8_9PSEU